MQTPDGCTLFLDYDIDDELPWHSTLSRTRQRIPEKVFNAVFEDVLNMCIEKGMVSGYAAAVDSALIKANASLDTMEFKQPSMSSQAYLKQLQLNSDNDEKVKKGTIKTGQTKANDLRYNPNDPEAKVATKPGKKPQFCYLSQAVVDSENHVILHADAYHADKKDSECLQEIVEKTDQKLSKSGIALQTVLADTNYSSGDNYKYLADKRIEAFIPLHGAISLDRIGFKYNKDKDVYVCPNNKELTFKKLRERGYGLERHYKSNSKDCKGCLLRENCIGKNTQKTLLHSIHREHYERMREKVGSKLGRRMRKLRTSTVEPVLGSLIHFYGLRKIWVKGKSGASKVTIMSALAYNLKKYLRFTKLLQVGNQVFINSLKRFFAKIAITGKEPSIYFCYKNKLIDSSKII